MFFFLHFYYFNLLPREYVAAYDQGKKRELGYNFLQEQFPGAFLMQNIKSPFFMSLLFQGGDSYEKN